jgi:hypothetical protein
MSFETALMTVTGAGGGACGAVSREQAPSAAATNTAAHEPTSEKREKTRHNMQMALPDPRTSHFDRSPV